MVTVADPTRPEAMAAAFVAALRRVGVAVPVGSAVAYFQALGALGLDDRDRVYWAGRATLVPDREDVALYDHVFRAFWDGHALVIDDRDRR